MGGETGCNFQRLIKESLSDKVTFELRPEKQQKEREP